MQARVNGRIRSAGFWPSLAWRRLVAVGLIVFLGGSRWSTSVASHLKAEERSPADEGGRTEPSSGERREMDEAKAAYEMGVKAYRERRFQDGITHAKEAVEILETQPGDENLRAAAVNLLGVLYKMTGDYARARPMLARALDIRKLLLGEEHSLVAGSLTNLAALNQEMGDFHRAEMLFQEALRIDIKVFESKRTRENVKRVATTYNHLGGLHNESGDYARAVEFFSKALQIREKVFEPTDAEILTLLNNLGNAYRYLGDYSKARPLLERAFETRKKALAESHPDLATSRNNLGALYRDMVETARAGPLLTEALRARKEALGEEHPDVARSLNDLALLYSKKGDFARAEPLTRQSLEILRRLVDLTSITQSERQQLLMKSRFQSALSFHLFLASKADTPVPDIYSLVLPWKGMVLERQRRMQVLRRSRPEVRSLFDRLQRVAAELASLVFSRPADDRKRDLEGLNEEKQKLERELAQESSALLPNRPEAPLSAGSLSKLLPDRTVLVDFYVYSTNLSFHGSGDSRPSGRENANGTSSRHLFAFVLRSGQPLRGLDLGPMQDIESAIGDWRVAIGATDRTAAASPTEDESDGDEANTDGSDRRGLSAEERHPSYTEPAGKLRRLILDPLEESLEGAELLVICPEGALGRIPFGALPGKNAGTFLVQDLSVAVVPFPEVLLEILANSEKDDGPREVPQTSLLVLGDVDYDAGPDAASPAGLPDTEDLDEVAVAWSRSAPREDENWARLGYTKRETALISEVHNRAFSGGHVTRLLGRGASETALRSEAPRHGFVHLATHGFFAPPTIRSSLSAIVEAQTGGPRLPGAALCWNPGLLSGVVLAGANHPRGGALDDGILTSLELATLELAACELLTFSACKTGLGESAGGEGLLGLQRAAHTAGARTVVATLWSVNDRDSQEFMTRFYENLWTKGKSKLEALREAQLEFLRDDLRRGGRDPAERRKESSGPEAGKDRGLEVRRGDSIRRSPLRWGAWVLSGDWR